jgi:hypothetical protein
MTETELLAAVANLINRVDQEKGPHGLVWHHCPDSRRCLGTPGFPDLFITGRHGIIVAELKSADGDTSAEQDLWIWNLGAAGWGDMVHIWRPEHLESGWIRSCLEAIA